MATVNDISAKSGHFGALGKMWLLYWYLYLKLMATRVIYSKINSYHHHFLQLTHTTTTIIFSKSIPPPSSSPTHSHGHHHHLLHHLLQLTHTFYPISLSLSLSLYPIAGEKWRSLPLRGDRLSSSPMLFSLFFLYRFEPI